MAEIVQYALADCPSDNRLKMQENSHIFILNETKTNGILIETGYISNPEEALKLCDPNYQQKLAEKIAKGLAYYFSKYGRIAKRKGELFMKNLIDCFLMPHPPIIIPEVGKEETKKVINTIIAVEKASKDIMEQRPHTIVIITPHGPLLKDSIGINMQTVIQGSMYKFGAPEVVLDFEINGLLIKHIIMQAERCKVKVVKLTEELAKTYHFSLDFDHGALVPLYFLHKAGLNCQVVHISSGILSNEKLYAFGLAVRTAIEKGDQRVTVIASGDLSHRLTPYAPAGYSELGKEFDTVMQQHLKNMNREALLKLDEHLIEEAGQCGYKPIVFLLGVIDGLSVQTEVLSYEGPFGVGYLVAKFAIDEQKECEV